MSLKNPAAVFDVSSTTPDNPFEGMSFPDYRDLRQKSRSFSGLAAYRLTTLAMAANPAAPAQIHFATLVSDNFFPVIGVTPAAGRVFLPDETTAVAQPVAMISYDFWKQNYASEQSAIRFFTGRNRSWRFDWPGGRFSAGGAAQRSSRSASGHMRKASLRSRCLTIH